MAQASDQLLVVAMAAYAVGMVLFAADFAFLQPRVALSRPVAAFVAVGGTQSSGTMPELTSAATPPVSRRLRQTAMAVTAVAWLAQVGCLVLRGLAADRVPWGNMYEFILAATLVGITVWLGLALRRPMLQALGLPVTFTTVLLLGIAGLQLYTDVAPLVPALNSYWLKIHVTAAVIASGGLMVGFGAAVLCLVKAGADRGKTRFPYTLAPTSMSFARLEQVTFRLHAFAFPIWTFAVIAGSIWAEAAWGRYWGWDPKEIWSFISWVVYAGYLHARATASVKRTTTSWIAVFGWCTMMINLFGVNLFASGLHSYAGL